MHTTLPSPRLAAEAITIGYGAAPILREVTLAVPPGRLTAIIGPNGSGKSTLLRTFARILKPGAGRVTLDGRPLSALGHREIARHIAMLPQSPATPAAMNVTELVARGRTPHLGLLRPWSAGDSAAVERALEMTHLEHLARTPLRALSGGQRQRAWIAMALAQDCPILLLDEPTSFLDIEHQVEVLKLLRHLAGQGRTVVCVLHEINLTARFADRVVALRDGRIGFKGPPAQAITEQTIRDTFGLDSVVMPCPVHGTPLVIPR